MYALSAVVVVVVVSVQIERRQSNIETRNCSMPLAEILSTHGVFLRLVVPVLKSVCKTIYSLYFGD